LLSVRIAGALPVHAAGVARAFAGEIASVR
jgi:hypothetical protein